MLNSRATWPIFASRQNAVGASSMQEYEKPKRAALGGRFSFRIIRNAAGSKAPKCKVDLGSSSRQCRD